MQPERSPGITPKTTLEAVAYQSLLDVSQAILQHRDLNGLFRDLSIRLHSILHFDFLNLILHDPDQNVMRLHILASATGVEQDLPALELPPEESPSGWVFLHQEPLVIPDVGAETRWPAIMKLLQQNNVVSSCWLPLTTAQHRLGAMVFGFGSDGQSESQLDLMRQIAAQVAVAVDNTLNFEKAETFQRQLARERDRLQILLEITNTLVSELDIRDLFPSIIACLRRAVPHEYSSLVLIVPGTDQLRVHARVYEGDDGILQESSTVPIDEAPAGRAVESKRPELFDRETLRQFPTPVIQRLIAAGIQSVCCVPLITRTRVLGTLNVGSTGGNAFGAADVDFLSQVAAQAAIAIENATAYQQIAELKDQLAKEKLYLEDEIRTDRNFGEIVGDSPAFKHVLDQVATVAPTDASVLILGETGTGKELIARAIHELSGRHGRTFVKLNCAAIPTGLLESELFGHEKGAFTGAAGARRGKFELADSGTIFLDEVGDLHGASQAKLLRVLQEGEFHRVGGEQTIRVAVRVVSATNRDLAAMVAQGKFREDLYYRLSVVPIRVPALRERPQDIRLLAEYFLDDFCARNNFKHKTLDDSVYPVLESHPWPGNARELRNVIERMAILTAGECLTKEAIPVEIRVQRDSGPRSSIQEARESAEREHILRALEEANWNVSGAARTLGMERTNLHKRIRALGLSRGK